MTGDDEVFSDLDRDAEDAIEAMNETAQEEFEQRQKIKALIDEGVGTINEGFTAFSGLVKDGISANGKAYQVQITVTTEESDFLWE